MSNIHRINRGGADGGSHELARVGSRGNLDQSVDDLELLNPGGTNKSSTETSSMTREEQMTHYLLVLNTPGTSEEQRRRALIKLGHYYAFDLWKASQIESDIAYLQKEKQRYQELLQEHENSSPQAMQFARDFNKQK